MSGYKNLIPAKNPNTSVYYKDEIGQGGAFHEYKIVGGPIKRTVSEILFQNGPIGDYGVNGCQQEDLLHIVAHRLECFQDGPFPHPKNAEALEHVRQAIAALNARTEERVKRGVEGKNIK